MTTATIDRELSGMSVSQQQLYRRCVENGCSHQMAVMLAHQQPPGVRGTDREFQKGQRQKMENYGGSMKHILRQARAAGIATQGKTYMAGLGHWTDPAAWASTIDDVRKVVEVRNLDCSGIVNHKAVEIEPKKKPVELAEHLVQQRMQEYLAKSPKLRADMKKNPRKTKAELREKIIDTHGSGARNRGKRQVKL